MDNSLQAVCSALKKIALQLKPQHNALSFLLLIGRDARGKTTLLRQSHLEHIAIETDRQADLYYNQQGIILELGESWLNQSKHLLHYTLKQLNHCHRALKITGLLLCIETRDLFITDPTEHITHCKAHTQLLLRFGQSLGYRVDAAILFTKLDTLAGFCEFFQNDHASELKKPLGFSMDWATRAQKIHTNYKAQFEHFIEELGQQVIQKMHPVRSSVKRTLIREFPLQVASLGRAIQTLIQTIPPHLFRLQALYFTSGEQGGISIDRLNNKIQHEYALTVQDTFPQSINHRAYFIEGAIAACQAYTKRLAPTRALSHQWELGLVASVAGITLVWMGANHFSSSRLLDHATKELMTYEILSHQQNAASALVHLTKASTTLAKLSTNTHSLPILHRLKNTLDTETHRHLEGDFLPTVLSEIEQVIVDSRQPQTTRYDALKVYLMLGDATRFSQETVLNWFQLHWQTAENGPSQEKITLLKHVIRHPFQPIAINRQIVSDVRNYLNALPLNYLYYALAKRTFSTDTQPIAIEGFDLANKTVPFYVTKAGFQPTLDKLPDISFQLQTDNWVLARQDLNTLPQLLQKAYCDEYVSWWQNFMRRSLPTHVKTYAQAKQLTEALQQTNALSTLVALIQHHTSPDIGRPAVLFNQAIASQFTELSLMSHTTLREVRLTLKELEQFLATLSVVQDQGRTAFNVVKSRFEGDTLSNPLSALYTETKQLPDPVSTWTKQIADDTWFILINDSRNHINQQWQQVVIQEYQYTIAKRYPLDASQTQEVALADFDRFFSRHGVLNTFVDHYLKPFLDMSEAQWQLKEVNHYVLPISTDMVNELIRANVITTMFFSEQADTSAIDFSLQKLNLDPIVASLQLVIGNTQLQDTQDSDSQTQFHWPQPNARLTLKSLEGKQYELEENGPWAFFKMLQKVNVLVDEQDSATLQILFEINGNSGRYSLKTQNQINPFTPGILNGFTLSDTVA